MPLLVSLFPQACGTIPCGWDEWKPGVVGLTAAAILLCIVLGAIFNR